MSVVLPGKFSSAARLILGIRHEIAPRRSTEERFADDDLRSTDFDDVTRLQLAASSNFGVTIHLDFAILNHELGVPAGASDGSQLQKLIQTKLGWFWSDVGFWQGCSTLLA